MHSGGQEIDPPISRPRQEPFRSLSLRQTASVPVGSRHRRTGAAEVRQSHQRCRGWTVSSGQMYWSLKGRVLLAELGSQAHMYRRRADTGSSLADKLT